VFNLNNEVVLISKSIKDVAHFIKCGPRIAKKHSLSSESINDFIINTLTIHDKELYNKSLKNSDSIRLKKLFDNALINVETENDRNILNLINLSPNSYCDSGKGVIFLGS